MKRILVCDFGNPYRRDDGVRQTVVNGVREQLEQAPLDSSDDEFNGLERSIDTVAPHQLVPEMAEIVVDYDLVIFVDAHVDVQSESLCEECITPACRSAAFASHQTHPATVLELAKKMYGYAPQAVMLSLRGHDFDFGEGLSRETATLVSLAVKRILGWARANPVDHKYNHLIVSSSLDTINALVENRCRFTTPPNLQIEIKLLLVTTPLYRQYGKVGC